MSIFLKLAHDVRVEWILAKNQELRAPRFSHRLRLRLKYKARTDPALEIENIKDGKISVLLDICLIIFNNFNNLRMAHASSCNRLHI